MSSLGDWFSQEVPQPVSDDAARWLALLDSGDCYEADRLAFARWLDEDPRHRWAFQELSEVWAQLRTLSDVKPLLDHPKVHRLPGAHPTPPRDAQGRSRGRREWSTVLAAAFALAGMVFYLAANIGTQHFETATGEVREVRLADGTTVELNAQTRMDVEMDRDSRRVRLSTGDAVFHVAVDGRPFIVSTARGSVAALGTSFAVRQEGGTMEVSVLSGRVAVTRAAAGLPLTVYDGKVDFTPRPATAVLDPGERIDVSAILHDQESVAPDALRRDLAWRDGVVVYEDEPLQAVIRDMRRYSRVSIHLADRDLRDLRVTGRFPIGDPAALLAHLSDHDGVQVDRGGPRWVVLRRNEEAGHP